MQRFMVLGLVLSAGCATTGAATGKDGYGWFHSTVTVQQRPYAEGFELVAARIEEVPCERLSEDWRPGRRPIYVVVHGAGGEGPEIQKSMPLLASGAPTALYVLRWSAWETQRKLVRRLARGVSHLARCAGDREVLVIAHSAGGVLAALAGGSIDAPLREGKPSVTLLTVGAPLSGAIGHMPGRRQAAHFFFDLARPLEYPEPAEGVRVIQLRTDLPGDVQMAPIFGHPPNDPSVGVPGAPMIDLPTSLSHSAALYYVSHVIVHDQLEEWLRDEWPGELQAQREAPAVRKQRQGRASPARSAKSLRR